MSVLALHADQGGMVIFQRAKMCGDGLTLRLGGMMPVVAQPGMGIRLDTVQLVLLLLVPNRVGFVLRRGVGERLPQCRDPARQVRRWFVGISEWPNPLDRCRVLLRHDP